MAITPTRWSPFQQIERMQRELDRLFAHVTSEGPPDRRAGWLPPVDIEQTADALVLKVDLPGIPRDAVSIEVHNGSLTISGQREEQRQDTHEGYVVHERISGSFARSFALPPHADPENVSATMKDGVLKVTIPRPTEESPRRITVS
jgi:HSP20 family protein